MKKTITILEGSLIAKRLAWRLAYIMLLLVLIVLLAEKMKAKDRYSLNRVELPDNVYIDLSSI
jgi:hypothetical protein